MYIALVLLDLNLKDEEIDMAFQKAENDGSLDEEEFVKMVSILHMKDSYFRMSEIESISLFIIFLLWWLLGGIIFSSVEGFF